MDTKIFFAVFTAVFIAELGDKTQLATILFAADKGVNKALVFLAAASALVLTSALGVVAGSVLAHYVSARYLRIVAGLGFIGIGAWMLLKR